MYAKRVSKAGSASASAADLLGNDAVKRAYLGV
jgi:hypothetical protein